jgi:trehalose-phosphatase
MLLPQFLREAAPDARIGFFLHVPFPSSSVFRILPRREELLAGLLGADYIAFHTYPYLQHFRSSLLRLLGLTSEMDRVAFSGRTIHFDALPIGIAPEEFTAPLENDEATRASLVEIREQFKDRRILLGVDRLDYTKGIPERLRTFGRLLEHSPYLQGRVVLIQIAVPSRENIPMYEELQHEVDTLVGQINGQWSKPDWTPIIYIKRGLPRHEMRRDLEKWFGAISGLWLFAEHGALARPPDAREWQAARANYTSAWKDRVMPILEYFTLRTPGSFIEEKELSIVWHYRMSDPEFGEWLANELVANLESLLAETELRAIRGQKAIEVKMAWANKGEVLARLNEAATDEPDFLLAAGDDTTDEDLFAQMPAESWTIHVGSNLSKARYRVTTPAAMLDCLGRLIQ